MSRTIGDESQEMDAAYDTFVAAYPPYAGTARLDELRATEYARLDRRGHVYLDYTGGSLHAASQLARHHELLNARILGNPHSGSRASLAATEFVERARDCVLEHFNASPDEYIAVFTPNASGALKHVGECYPFGPGGRFVLTFDNHNSVNGIREFARARGADVTYAPISRDNLRIDRARLTALLGSPAEGGSRLFAFPAQSNFSGAQHPLELIDEAHEAGWDVLLDAAAFVPTNRLDLAALTPDLVAISFYKMFGYPTGIGCLLMRRSIAPRMRRPWFAGGTIQIATVQGDAFYRAKDAAAFEDGTVDYLNLPAVEIGLRHLAGVGMDRIHERVRCLTGWLLDRMRDLRHENGRALVQIHGPASGDARGGTIAFNLFDPSGAGLDIRRIEELANESGISLRTGCFCNPGAGEVAYGLGREEIGAYFQDQAGLSFDELRARIRSDHGLEVGAIRVSVGIASNFADAYRFVEFARGFLNRSEAEVGRAVGCSVHDELRRDGA